jgi:hypothetical protein
VVPEEASAVTVDGVIPAPDHLYTWVDVDEHFALLAILGYWPAWLVEVSAFWDSVEFTVEPGTPECEIWSWLAAALGPLTVDLEIEAQLLEVNGVLFREDDQFWMPEIYSRGPGFRVTGRPRVLAVAKLARGTGGVG